MSHNYAYLMILCYNETKKDDFSRRNLVLNENSKLKFILLIGIKNEVESIISDKIAEI